MKWRCTVCGYIHEGDNPPETCPVCGAPSNKFVLLEDKGVEKESLEKLDSLTTDVIAVGSGAAGLSTAIVANDLGLDVMVLEKGEFIGGTTARSGGRYWIPNNYAQKELGIVDNKEDAIKYMARYSFSHKYDVNKEYYGLREMEYKLIETYYDNASVTVDFMKTKGVMESEAQINWKGTAEVDYMDTLEEQKAIRGRTIYPKTDSKAAVTGSDLIELMKLYLNKKNIKVHTKHKVTELIVENDKVIGVVCKKEDGIQKIYARKGVIFASGGFSHNKELMDRFHMGPHYGGCAVGENQGDIIKLTEPLGVKLGNMSSAFRVQSIVDLYFKNPTGTSSLFYIIGDSILQVNKYGKRVMNEKRNYTDRTMTHFYWDPVKGEWMNRYLFLIFDERTAKYWAGYPPLPLKDIDKTSYIISGNDYAELISNIEDKLDDLKDETANFKLDKDFNENFKETIERFNGFAKTGVDEDFHRGESPYDREFVTFPPINGETNWPDKDNKNVTMHPLSDSGPYYAMILGAGTLDTNGGPMINTNGQILRYDDEKIVGLYGAGNCIASPSRNAYWGAGATIGPAMTFARLAVEHASKQENNI